MAYDETVIGFDVQPVQRDDGTIAAVKLTQTADELTIAIPIRTATVGESVRES